MAKIDYSEKRAKWFSDNGFNNEEKTYVYFPSNSYEVKDELKDAGFRFNSNLFWHIAEVPEGYEDKVIEISLRDVAEMTAWGTGLYSPEAKQIVSDKMIAARPVEETGEWIAQEKEKIVDYPVILVSVRGMDSRYGWTQLVKFRDEDGNEINWWTSVEIKAEVGANVLLSGTVKKLDEYQGRKITVLTRCRIKEA